MKLGRIQGKVWATVKDPKLNNCTLYILQPVDEDENPIGMDGANTGHSPLPRSYWIN